MTNQAAAPIALEQEVIILGAIWGMIDNMVNYALFMKNERFQDTNLMFETRVCAKMFNILLVDFLSPIQIRNKEGMPFGLPTPPPNTKPSNLTYLFYLRQVCANPQLGGDVTMLSGEIEAFGDWLEAIAFVPKVWLPSIDTELDMSVARIEFLRICGDIAKHNFSRMKGNVVKICRIMAENGHPISERDGYLMLEEFFEWFHTHLFMYHSSTIAEFLNNIRWEIYEYLRPEFLRSYKRLPEPRMYTYNVPALITDEMARSMYWDIMNKSLQRPWFPKFSVTTSLKMEF